MKIRRGSFTVARRIPRYVPAALGMCLLFPTSGVAAPTVTGEFALSEKPGHLAAGPDGNVWVTLSGAKNLARVTPDGTVTEFAEPASAGAVGVTTGSDGAIWVTVPNGVVRVPADNPAAETAHTIVGLTAPGPIVTGADGQLWTASGDQVFRIPPAAPATYTAFTVPDLSARGLAASTDGHLWIADFGGTTNGRVIRMALDGSFTATAVGGGVMGVAGGPGGAVGFTNPLAMPQFIGQQAPGSVVQSVEVPGVDPFGIVAGIDGAYWTANFADQSLGRLAPDGSYTRLTGFSPNAGPRYLTVGPDGRTLWVGLEVAQKVARISGLEPPASPPGSGGGGGASGGDARPAGDWTPPRILHLRLRPTVTRAGGRVVAPRRGRRGVGTRISYRLSEVAGLRLRVYREVAGRRVKQRCVKPSRRLSKTAKRCVRLQSVGVHSVRERRKTGTVKFTGRLGKRTLKPGRYRIQVIANDATGNRSVPRTLRLRIVAR